MNINHRRSSLFLMEMIITILFFSLASSVCIQCFVKAHNISKNTIELNHSIALAQGYAEVMRGTDGSMESILMYYPDATVSDSSFIKLFYDSDFAPCKSEDASYVANVMLHPEGSIQNMDINISRIIDSSTIYQLTATKYMGNKQ